MTDTLKQFSSSENISYSDLIGSGHSLASTTGSQKAVIKDVSISNSKGRQLDVKLGSVNGVAVASTTNKIDTLSGNLILDNSNSIHLSSPDKCAITDFRQTGWGNGVDMSQNHFTKWGNVGTQFGNFEWDGWIPGLLSDSGNNDPWGGSSVEIGFGIQNVSYSFVANGRFYWNHKRTSGTYGVDTMRSTPIPGTNNNDIYTYGSGKASVMVYDGTRYIYTLGNGDTALRKYDTTTLGSSDTYTSINLLQPDSDSAAQTINTQQYPCGYYYRDGFILINGGNGQANTYNNSCPMIVSCSTGKTKRLYDPRGTNGFSNVPSAYMRRPIGIAKDSAGTYYGFIGTVKYINSNNNENQVNICTLGSDIETDFLANGKTYGNTYDHNMPDWNTGSNERRRLRQIMCQSGYHFGNPSGPIMHTPGLNRYLWTYVTYYSSNQTSRSGLSEQDYPQAIFDFDKVGSDTDEFIDVPSRSSVRPHKAEFSGYIDGSNAGSAFGSVKARVSGILIT